MNSHRFGTALVLSCLVAVPAGSALASPLGKVTASKAQLLGTTVLAQTEDTTSSDPECVAGTEGCAADESGEQKSSDDAGGDTESGTDDGNSASEGGGDANEGGDDGGGDGSDGSDGNTASEGGGDAGGDGGNN